MFDLTFAQIVTSMVFGSTGFVCFVYGKKQASWKPMVGGLGLMVLPYLVHQTMTLWFGGALILGWLCLFRD